MPKWVKIKSEEFRRLVSMNINIEIKSEIKAKLKFVT